MDCATTFRIALQERGGKIGFEKGFDIFGKRVSSSGGNFCVPGGEHRSQQSW
jgi:hypothetical protein